MGNEHRSVFFPLKPGAVCLSALSNSTGYYTCWVRSLPKHSACWVLQKRHCSWSEGLCCSATTWATPDSAFCCSFILLQKEKKNGPSLIMFAFKFDAHTSLYTYPSQRMPFLGCRSDIRFEGTQREALWRGPGVPVSSDQDSSLF